MTLEQALDETIKGVQNHLNSLQSLLRQLAACEDQEIDEDDDFKQGVDLEDSVTDTVAALGELLSELRTSHPTSEVLHPPRPRRPGIAPTVLSASLTWHGAKKPPRLPLQPKKPPPRLYRERPRGSCAR